LQQLCAAAGPGELRLEGGSVELAMRNGGFSIKVPCAVEAATLEV
jgi:hypothetical protein